MPDVRLFLFSLLLLSCAAEDPSIERLAYETHWDGNLCPEIPPRASSDPPGPETGGARCRWMDWDLSPDGFYIVSQFGTTQDHTTMGRGTSCSALQTHYAAQCCLYDIEQDLCLDEDASGQRKVRKWQAPRGEEPDECHVEDVPETGPPVVIEETRTRDYWYLRRSIDFNYWTVILRVAKYFFPDGKEFETIPSLDLDDFAHPEYFYVAGAQRFGCGAYLRVTNPRNNRCVVVYADDGGPGSSYEGVWHASRRILDASPAVNRFLGSEGIGPARGDMMFVEWALPGDAPGQPCTPCESMPAMRGTEELRSPFDLAHGFSGATDCRSDDVKQSFGVHGGTPVTYAP
jgi:hypothetical protein